MFSARNSFLKVVNISGRVILLKVCLHLHKIKVASRECVLKSSVYSFQNTVPILQLEVEHHDIHSCLTVVHGVDSIKWVSFRSWEDGVLGELVILTEPLDRLLVITHLICKNAGIVIVIHHGLKRLVVLLLILGFYTTLLIGSHISKVTLCEIRNSLIKVSAECHSVEGITLRSHIQHAFKVLAVYFTLVVIETGKLSGLGICQSGFNNLKRFFIAFLFHHEFYLVNSAILCKSCERRSHHCDGKQDFFHNYNLFVWGK